MSTMTGQVQRTFETPEPVRLHCELPAGSIRTTATASEHAHVEVSGPRAEEFVVELRGRELAVLAPRDRHGRALFRAERHDVSVVLPTGSDLDVQAGSADVRAEGTYGEVRTLTGSGEVLLDDVTGDGRVESGSGDVSLGHVGGSLRLKAGSGDLTAARVGGDLAVTTGSGGVRVGQVGGSTQVKTGSGDTELGEAGDVRFGAASGGLSVERLRPGTVAVTNVSGDVRLGVPAGMPVWTDIGAVTGRVTSDLGSVGAPAEGQPYVEVRATTVSGSIHLRQV